jgi:hypothetical protein
LLVNVGQAQGITLPAGSYIVGGTVYFGDAANPDCTLTHTISGGTVGIGSNGVAAPSTAETIPMADEFTVSAPSTLWVDCTGGGSSFIDPYITVIQVATLH